MTRPFPLLAALGGLILGAPALRAQEPVVLIPGQVYQDSVAGEEIDAYSLHLEASRFVVGEADQKTADVVVSVYGPDGALLATFDGPDRGPEPFHFDAKPAGMYRIEVKAFEGGAGEYAILIRRVEPIAADPADRVDQLMVEYSGDVPGGVVGVVQDGELVFARAYGMADLTHEIPFAVDTRTNLGSTSKQFTAFAIALLASRGELSLDDEVRTHIPELPDFGEPVTLRNLLTHTSGYREFLNALALAGRRLDEGDHIGRGEIIALVQRQPELQNAPGAEWNYNNTGFALLAMVVERVAGQPFPEWMAENVFGPLGMDATQVRAHPARIVPHSARGYSPEEGGWREAEDLGAAMGAGGMYSTVADMARWIRSFEAADVGSAEIHRLMTTPFVLTDGDTTDYGFGLFIDEYRGLERIHHGGADVAHRAMLRYYPEIHAGVVTLSNNATFNSDAMSDDVADAFFADHLEPEDEPAEDAAQADAPFDPATYDPATFDGLAGRYSLDEMPAFVLSFFREGDTLFTQATGQPRIRMTPTSVTTFRLEGVDASLTFHPGPEGAADSLTLHQNGNHLAHRIEGWDPSPAELEEYAGRYFSTELETFYIVELSGETLTLNQRRFEEPAELSAGKEKDHFTGGFPVAEVRFLRDASGAVVGLEAANGRTRGVRFDRLDADSPSGS